MGLIIQRLDHAAIPVTDLARSVAFYRDVLLLTEMDRPDFGFPGAWFRLGDDQELHLIARGNWLGGESPKERHLSLRVEDIESAREHLARAGWPFDLPKRRPDDAWQIFLDDPDGHTIELCQVNTSD